MSTSQWKRTVRQDNEARARWEADATAQATMPERPTGLVHARLGHHFVLSQNAWVDAKKLVGIEVGDSPITIDELHRYVIGTTATQWHALAVQPKVPVPSAKDPGAQDATEMSNDVLHGAQRDLQKQLLRAFDLRFANNPKGRALLTSIRRGRSVADCLEDTRSLRTLVQSDEHRAWFAALPRGESALFARLETLDAEQRSRLGRHTSEEDAEALAQRQNARARLQAMLAMLDALERRVVLAGRYAWHGEGGDKRYRRFASTRPRKRTKK